MSTKSPRRPRRRALPVTPEMVEGAPDFAPVPRGSDRFDGWTPDRQRAFVKRLAETGSVTRAAAHVGMAEVGAYQLRKAPGAEAFAQAWADALAVGVQRLEDVAFERAMNGVAVPVFYQGEQVGERRAYNDRLLMWTLRHHDPDRYKDGHRLGSDSLSPTQRDRLRRQFEEEQRAAGHAPAEPRDPEAEAAEDAALKAEFFRRLQAMEQGERDARADGDHILADEQRAQRLLILARLRMLRPAQGAGGSEAGAGDPALPPPSGREPMLLADLDPTIWSGPTFNERARAQDAARADMNAARARYDAAAREATWAEWKARGR